MDDRISIQGLDKAEVLAALYNASRPQGFGFLKYDPKPMTREEAQNLLKERPKADFDYLNGRVMKVNLSGDDFSPYAYDRDNGSGAAEEAITALRISGDVNPLSVQVTHEDGKHRAANVLREHLPGQSVVSGNSIHLGFGDAASPLGIVLEAKMRDADEPVDFRKLAEAGERVSLNDSISSMLYKFGEGDAEAMKILQMMLDDEEIGIIVVLWLDSQYLYGHRIAQVYHEVCGGDMKRFLYHIQMELPNQGTGELWITGPHAADMSEDDRLAHCTARRFGKPGSFWALEHPPTDPNYEYPIKV